MLRHATRSVARANVLRNSISSLRTATIIPKVVRFQSTSSKAPASDSVYTDAEIVRKTLHFRRVDEKDARKSPHLIALHARLNLPESFQYSTLSQCLNLLKNDGGLASNYGLQALGNSIMAYYVNEYLCTHYPRLPLVIHQASVDALMGVSVLSEIGQSWGIEIDEPTKLDKMLSEQRDHIQLGKLRYETDIAKRTKITESGIEEVNGPGAHSTTQQDKAFASVVKAVVGGLYTHAGEDAAKQFINDHILSRKLLLEEMFEFQRPFRELADVVKKTGSDAEVTIRLIAETGRKTVAPQFLCGVFAGDEQLSDAIGGSLNEAKTRAAVNGLMSYYLYSPINSEGEQIKVPSDKEYKVEGIIGEGDIH
ncbi:MRPL3 [[Candida] subhashii]|uniref:MRPL3 n=1 Tax=[Candida] subhashii TaxID=561895 RepID=A0A8J5UVN9_9ASCO|nr:MRPL3 [[Candida] subhashii]KAG7661159.1 MRPL3 [[Candida] subhashii]